MSYKLCGLSYEIHNTIGSVYSEKQYQEAFESKLKFEKIKYEREKDLMFNFGHAVLKGNRVDFVIEDKIAVDLKAKKYITREDFRQMLRYLKSGGYKLGLIINFGEPQVTVRRVINSDIRQ